jgi:hypothetical protein
MVTGRGISKDSERILPHCPFVHHKSHVYWLAPNPGLHSDNPAGKKLGCGPAFEFLKWINCCILMLNFRSNIQLILIYFEIIFQVFFIIRSSYAPYLCEFCQGNHNRSVPPAAFISALLMEKRNAYRVLVGKPDGKGPVGRLKCRW